jgi:hypothetical protein
MVDNRVVVGRYHPADGNAQRFEKLLPVMHGFDLLCDERPMCNMNKGVKPECGLALQGLALTFARPRPPSVTPLY